jgi:hypothetical protein
MTSLHEEKNYNNDYNVICAKDKYCWVDYVVEMSKTFNSIDDLIKSFKINQPRVFVKIEFGSGFFLKKDTITDLYNMVNMPALSSTYRCISRNINKKGQISESLITMSLPQLLNNIQKTTKTLPLRLYSKQVYKPMNHNLYKNEFNTWINFKGTSTDPKFKIDMTQVNPILEYIRTIIADNDTESYNFILAWLAHIVQKPWKKSEIAIFLQSTKQGTGKGTFVNWLKNYVFGSYCSMVTCGLKSLTQKHNGSMAKKSFIVVDELPTKSGDFHSQFDTMKHLITEPTLSIEPKGKEIYQIDNMANFIMCSNNKFPLKISKGDRRYACFEVSACKKGDVDYWNNIHQNVLIENTAKHFFKYLENLPSYNLKIPNTKLRQDITTNSLPSYELFIMDIKSGDFSIQPTLYIPPFKFKGENIKNALLSDILYRLYKSYCDSRDEKTIRQRLFMNAMQDLDSVTYGRNSKFRFYKVNL